MTLEQAAELLRQLEEVRFSLAHAATCALGDDTLPVAER